MARGKRNGSSEKKVTRYTHEELKEPRTPETGHTALLPSDETVVTLQMDNGWINAVNVAKLPEKDAPVVVDMDPSVDPVLFWAGKRSKRDIPVLPLQRNEIVSESRIAQILARARDAATKATPAQIHLFADLEKSFRETERTKRVEFYTHQEGWKNKLICGDSLQVMESLLQYEGLRGQVQMAFIDPPYGISYNSNIQQRIDTTQNVQLASTGRKAGELVKIGENVKDLKGEEDVLSVKAFRDT